MPKQKSHKGLGKRVKKTGRGKVLRRKAGKSHLLSGKSAKRRRKTRRPTTASRHDARAMLRELGDR